MIPTSFLFLCSTFHIQRSSSSYKGLHKYLFLLIILPKSSTFHKTSCLNSTISLISLNLAWTSTLTHLVSSNYLLLISSSPYLPSTSYLFLTSSRTNPSLLMSTSLSSFLVNTINPSRSLLSSIPPPSS
jgi:hypothetical protein